MRLRLFLALAIALSVTGCGGNALEYRVETSFDVPKSVQNLDFEFGGGAIVFVDREDDLSQIQIAGTVVVVSKDSEVEARFGEDFDVTPRFSVSEDGQTVVLRLADLPEGLQADLDASQILKAQVRVPKGLDLKLHSVAGRSRIQLDHHAGDAEVLADGGGEILLSNCEGHVHGRLATGPIQVFDHQGSLDITTGEGTVWARIQEIGERGIRLHSETPSLICFLPEEASFDLDARTIQSRSGKLGVITRAFDVKADKVHSVHPKDPSRGEVVGHRARAQVRGGGPLVDLQVQFGHLSVAAHKPGSEGSESGE